MKVLSDERVALLREVAETIRGDWSGMNFDGRDVKKWINLALDGTDEEAKNLLEDLPKWRKGWYGF